LLVAISRKTAGEASVTNECVLIQYGALSSSPSDQAKKAEKQLRISGVEVTFEGLVPKGFAERTKVISEALDKAFARPI
jgi:hypothetical protein